MIAESKVYFHISQNLIIFVISINLTKGYGLVMSFMWLE